MLASNGGATFEHCGSRSATPASGIMPQTVGEAIVLTSNTGGTLSMTVFAAGTSAVGTSSEMRCTDAAGASRAQGSFGGVSGSSTAKVFFGEKSSANTVLGHMRLGVQGELAEPSELSLCMCVLGKSKADART